MTKEPRAPTRSEIQQMYIRVCRDSRFKMPLVQAAHLAAKVLGVSALQVWIALDFSNMERIANGTHECLRA